MSRNFDTFFRAAYEANKPVDLGFGDALGKMVDRKIQVDEINRENEKIAFERQKEFEKARAEFKTKMSETYDQFVYEDQFDDTGLTDLDNAAAKLQGEIRDVYELNEFAFRNGFIDESQLTVRNNKVKGQVMQFKNLTGDINKYLAEADKLEKEGKGSVLNDMKTKLLDEFSGNVKFGAGLDGLTMSTKDADTGETKSINMGQFKKLITASEGVDTQKDIDDIIDLGGFNEFVSGNKKIKDFTSILDNFDKEGNVFDVALSGKSDEQLLDMMYKLNLADDDPKMAASKGQRLVQGEDIFSFKATEEDKTKIKKALRDETLKQLELKRQQAFYEDPRAIEAYKNKLRNQRDPIHTQGMEKREVTVTKKDGTIEKVENSFDTYMPKKIPGKPSGINISYALKQTDSDSGEKEFASRVLRKMNDKLKPGERTLGIDAIKKATLLQGERNKNTGQWTFRVGIDLSDEVKNFGAMGQEDTQYQGGSYAEVIEINPGTLKDINMYYQNLTGEQLSNTSQQEFLKSLKGKQEAGEKLTPQERATLGQSGQQGAIAFEKLKSIR